MSGFIHKTSRVQPGAGERDIIELSKRVEMLSRQISAEERPQASARFVERPVGATNATTIDLVSGGGANLKGSARNDASRPEAPGSFEPTITIMGKSSPAHDSSTNPRLSRPGPDRIKAASARSSA